jgi:predicted amidophosphoribosyltransferase
MFAIVESDCCFAVSHPNLGTCWENKSNLKKVSMGKITKHINSLINELKFYQ